MTPPASKNFVVSSDDLLAAGDPSKPIGPFDARTAAFVGNNSWICTTPNHGQIFLPPAGHQKVYLCADYRFGAHDHTLWPQPFIPKCPHLGAIPRRSGDPNNPLNVMWWNPTRADFVPAASDVIDGLGQLSSAQFKIFEVRQKELEVRIEKYMDANDEPLEFILGLNQRLKHAYTRLHALQVSYEQMRFCVTDFQRLFLEMRGVLDYMEIYKRRIEGVLPAARVVEECIGLFTNSPVVAQDCFTAGLPFWLIRPAEYFRSANHRFMKITDIIFEPKMLIETNPLPHSPPSPPIFEGTNLDERKHTAIHQYCWTWLSYQNPFEASTASEKFNSQSSSSSPPNANSQKNPASISKNIQSSAIDRNKFLPLDKPLAPFPIPAWSHALRDVDRSPSRLISETKPFYYFGHYAYPDPGLLVTPSDPARRAQYFEKWLRLRRFWQLRVSQRPSPVMSGQMWRDFLNHDIFDTSKMDKLDKRSAARRQTVLNIMTSCDMPNVSARNTLSRSIFWQGKEYVPNGPLPDHVVREILWELYEVNFVHELLALDICVCTNCDFRNHDESQQRFRLIMNCFNQPSALLPSITLHNVGLASDNLATRMKYVRALAIVMSRWPNAPHLFTALKEDMSVTRDRAEEIERLVAKFYTQTFFNYFGRAAQIPHRLYRSQN